MTFERLIEQHSEQLEPPTADEVDYIFHVNETQSVENIIELMDGLKNTMQSSI